MAVIDLSRTNSIVNQYLSEIRDANIQQDRLRFRKNMERCGEILAYEISKVLPYRKSRLEHRWERQRCRFLRSNLYWETILRAGMILHQGLLNVFDHADNAFVSAYRKHWPDRFRLRLLLNIFPVHRWQVVFSFLPIRCWQRAGRW
jgi:uracil phosphoribosyltransferase